jgi:hypothetical protein
MTKVTYIGAEGEPIAVTCHGRRFKANVPVEISPDVKVEQLETRRKETENGDRLVTVKHQMSLVKLLAGNPQFRVEGHELAVQKTPERVPESPEEMVEHTLAWIRATADVEALDALWDREQSMRDECGVTGTLHEEKIATAFELRRAVVKRMNRQPAARPAPPPQKVEQRSQAR